MLLDVVEVVETTDFEVVTDVVDGGGGVDVVEGGGGGGVVEVESGGGGGVVVVVEGGGGGAEVVVVT